MKKIMTGSNIRLCIAVMLALTAIVTAVLSYHRSIAAAPADTINSQLMEQQDETLATTDAPEPLKHLDFYDEFPMYNGSWDYFKGFVLSEVWIGEEPYYQLLNAEKDVEILVDRTQENAVIYHAGNSMDYDMKYLISGIASYTTVNLLDITEDGIDELIITHTGTGTGMMSGECDVINLKTMTEYPIEDYLNELGSRVSVEPVEIDGDYDLICKVTDMNGTIYYGSAQVGANNLLNDFAYLPEKYSIYYNISVDYEKQCLAVFLSMVMDPYGGCHLGGISSYLRYNIATGHFELTDEFTVDLNSSIDPKEYELGDGGTNLSDDNKQLRDGLLDQIIAEKPLYEGYDVKAIADDFNGDGNLEFFFVYTEKGTDLEDPWGYTADLWFGSKKGIQMVVEQQSVYLDWKQQIVTIGQNTYFLFDRTFASSSFSWFILVKDDLNLTSFLVKGHAIITDGEDDFQVVGDSYDFYYDKEYDYTIGHSWKDYYYYADKAGIHEYGAELISAKKFREFRNSEAILDGIREKYEAKFPGEAVTVHYEFYQRCNGLIHINISCETESGITYYYNNFIIDSDQMLEFYEEGDGRYYDALDDEMAVYLKPSKSFLYD